jgi:hypothetical protein
LFDAPQAVEILAGCPSSRQFQKATAAQDGSKAPPLGGGTGATRSPFFTGEHGEEPPFDASEHRGTCHLRKN